MKADRSEFARCVGPVMADVQRTNPGEVRLVYPEDGAPTAWLLDAADLGTGLDMSSGWSPAEGVLAMTEAVKDAVMDALWTTWPSCPRHPDTHPMSALIEHGLVVWTCPVDGIAVAAVGDLPTGG